ncbi:MAG: SDR family NAD(P)-dependent oxidoreductase, partial [Anaerolineae bacterium]|nr:SDR family NAD(P)-dependent oxidoreductase [Anaerolineae bacterium]
HLVIEEYQETVARRDSEPETEPHLIVLSARNEDRLRMYAQKVLIFLEQAEQDQAVDSSKPSLASLAYTLQVGREAMEVRLALVVSSIDDLIEKLRQYAQKQTSSARVYQSHIKTGPLKSELLVSGEAGAAFIRIVIRNRELDQLAQLWVSGVEIDWSLLYGQETPKRISLPTYPFERKRYWFDAHQAHHQPMVAPRQPAIQTSKPHNEGKLILKPIQSVGLPPDEVQAKNILSLSLPPANPKNVTPNENRSQSVTPVRQTSSPSASDVKKEVRALLISTLYLDGAIDEDKPFNELGMDSITGVEFVKAVNQTFAVAMKIGKLYDYPTLREMAAYVVRLVDKAELSHPGHVEHTDAGYDGIEAETTVSRLKLPNVTVELAETPRELISPSVMNETDVAVIGLAGRFPGADNLDQYWHNLKEGICSVAKIPPERWDVARYYDPDPHAPNTSYSQWGGFLSDIDKFDPRFFNLSPAEAKVMDPQQRLVLEEAYHALEDAGYGQQSIARRACGLYVGLMGGNEYQRRVEQTQPAQAMMGNAGSILAGRVAYAFDLQGPVITVDTACSSSLVAVDMACKSLINREVEMMLAGGVTLYLTEQPYIGMSKAHMLSPAGLCKTFDAQADGFVPGEGVGFVMLKLLSRARADGDTIYGVIKGSGVNQDGRTNGLTAPNVKSQRDLQLAVYRNYGLDPSEITYVETHGTGTKLGDPIEVEALTESFRHYTEASHYCAIGSVKTNIGHTSAAAGVAGLIKVLLSLKYKKLLPSLHFAVPNEHIDFENSPFYVNTEFKDWSVAKGPRRAAVSSFGFSGTNAHVVLEEYVSQELEVRSQQAEGGLYLIVLSARNEAQLHVYAQKLMNFLTASPDISLAELAYTLQVGREAMSARLALVVENETELQEALVAYGAGKVESERLFTGQLTRQKRTINLINDDEDAGELVTTWLRKGKLAKLAELWVEGVEVDWTLLYGAVKPRRMSLPTYPFARERHWLSNSGPLPVADSQLAMAPIHPLVHQNTSTLTGQRFTTTFTGTEFFLNDHRVQGEKVLPGVAYLEMALAAGEMAIDHGAVTQLKDVVWLRPLVVKDMPLKTQLSLHPTEDGAVAYEISSFDETGQAVVHGRGKLVSAATAEAAQVIDLEAIRQRCPETKSGAACYRRFEAQGLTYGPTFQVIEDVVENEMEALARLRLPAEVGSEAYGLHPSLLDGLLQSVIGLMADSFPSKLYLPFALDALEVLTPPPAIGYAYVTRLALQPDTARFNIALLDEGGRVCLKLHNVTIKSISPAESNWYYRPYWERQALAEAGRKRVETTGSIVLVIPREMETVADTLVQRYSQQHVVRLIMGDRNIRLNETDWMIDLTDSAGLADSLSGLAKVDTLYFLGGLLPPPSISLDLNNLAQSQEQGVLSLFRLVKIWEQHRLLARVSALKVLTAQAQQCYPQESVQPWSASLSGLTMSLAREYPAVEVSCIDVVLTTNEEGRPIIAEADVTALLVEKGESGQPVALRQGVWYVRRLAPLRLPAAQELPYRRGGVYLLLGGAGGIGLETAAHLAEQVQAKLVLIGRSNLTPEKEARLHRIRMAGGDYLYCQADGTDLAQMQAVVRQAKDTFGAINGVIHSALVLKDGAISMMDEATFRTVLAPKVTASVVLAEVVKDEPLDFMLFFSSSQSFLGNAGQSNYAAGCMFADALALYLNTVKPYPVKIINWGYWGSVGVVATEAYRQQLAKQGIRSIEVEDGLAAIDQVVAGAPAQVVAIKADRPVLKHLGVAFDRAFKLIQPEYASVLSGTVAQLIATLPSLLPDQTILQQDQAGFKALEAVAQMGLLQAFQRQEVLQQADESYDRQALARQLSIMPGYRRLYDACLNVLAQAGYLSLTETQVETTANVAQTDRQGLVRQQDVLAQRYPLLRPHLALLETCLQALPDIIRGHI